MPLKIMQHRLFLKHFGFTRQMVSTLKKKKNASLMLVGVTCPMCTSTLNITREKYSQDIGKIVSRSEV